MATREVFFQLVLALLGVACGFAAAILGQRWQKWLFGVASVALITASALWVGYELGIDSSTGAVSEVPSVGITVTPQAGSPSPESNM